MICKNLIQVIVIILAVNCTTTGTSAEVPPKNILLLDYNCGGVRCTTWLVTSKVCADFEWNPELDVNCSLFTQSPPPNPLEEYDRMAITAHLFDNEVYINAEIYDDIDHDPSGLLFTHTLASTAPYSADGDVMIGVNVSSSGDLVSLPLPLSGSFKSTGGLSTGDYLIKHRSVESEPILYLQFAVIDESTAELIRADTLSYSVESLLTGQIPTLTEWGLIIFGVLLAGWMGWIIIHRRKRVMAGF